MTRHRAFDIIAIISTAGILTWISTEFFGGMFIYFLSYPLIIILIIILYVFSIVDTLISIVKNGLRQYQFRVAFHCLVIITIIAVNIYQSEIFRAKRILTATLEDDLFHYTLIFRDNGSCENEVSGFLGFKKIYYGKYTIHQDTIVFQKKPYVNDFIPDTLLIDKKSKAIFFNKDKEGKFNRTKEWLNYFEIH